MTAPRPDSVLLVVQHPGNARVLRQAVAEIGMQAVHADSATSLEASLAGPEAPRAALVDVSGFGTGVWSLCQRLQAAAIPFIVMSPPRDQRAGNHSLAYGATSVLHKPVAKDGLLQLLRSLNEQ